MASVYLYITYIKVNIINQYVHLHHRHSMIIPGKFRHKHHSVNNDDDDRQPTLGLQFDTNIQYVIKCL